MNCINEAHQSTLQKRMAKKHGHISRTDQNTPQTNYRKDLMSSKENHTRAVHANFSPKIYEDDDTRHIPTEKLQNQSIRNYICSRT